MLQLVKIDIHESTDLHNQRRAQHMAVRSILLLL